MFFLGAGEVWESNDDSRADNMEEGLQGRDPEWQVIWFNSKSTVKDRREGGGAWRWQGPQCSAHGSLLVSEKAVFYRRCNIRTAALASLKEHVVSVLGPGKAGMRRQRGRCQMLQYQRWWVVLENLQQKNIRLFITVAA